MIRIHVSRLETLIEQTSFLLERQEEVKLECDDIFRDFLNFLQQKINDFNEEEEQQSSLEKVHDMISGHAQKLTDEAQEDIEFLREQLRALQEVSKIADPTRAKEILAEMIDEDEEIPDTEEFKVSVQQESIEAKSNLLAMVDDVKEALRDGDVKEVELLLEAMVEEQSSGDINGLQFSLDDEDEEDGGEQQGGNNDNEEGEASSGGCCGSGGCAPGGCGDCSMDCGPAKGATDIFSMLGQYERELEQDLAQDKNANK